MKPSERFQQTDLKQDLEAAAAKQQQVQQQQPQQPVEKTIEEPEVPVNSDEINLDDLEIVEQDNEEITRLNNLLSQEKGRRKALSDKVNSLEQLVNNMAKTTPKEDTFDLSTMRESLGDDIVDATTKIAQHEVAKLQQKITSLENSLQKKTDELQGKIVNNTVSSVTAQVEQAVPNCRKYINSPKFNRFLSQRLPGSIKTLGQNYDDAFDSGNAGVMIEIFREFEKSIKSNYENKATGDDSFKKSSSSDTDTSGQGNTYRKSDIDKYMAECEKQRRRTGKYPEGFEKTIDEINKATRENRIALHL